MATYVLLGSTTLTSTSASISFTSIPSTYTDLVVRWTGRCSHTTLDSARLTLNSTSTGFTGQVAYADFGGPSQSVFADGQYAGTNLGTGQTSNTFSTNEIYITRYAQSYKKIISVNSETIQYSYFAGLEWNNTAAITTVTLTPNAGHWVTSSTASLYGIKNS